MIVNFAGQMFPDQMPQVVEHGYKSVINNRPDFEQGPDQPSSEQMEAAAKTVGLAYAYIPVVSGHITEKNVQDFAAAFNTMPKPILMFCRSGARSNNLFQLAEQMNLLDD